MKFYTIEVDEKVWNYLKKNAEPFKDTPNSVLNRLIFGTGNKPASTIIPPPKPYEKQPSMGDFQSENDLTVDGIKLQLESQNESERNAKKISLDSPPRSPSEDLKEVHVNIENSFQVENKEESFSLGPSMMPEKDKDIDDFIDELEKSSSMASVKDEFSNMLKEVAKEEGEWQEISIQPKQNVNTGNRTSTIEFNIDELSKTQPQPVPSEPEKPPKAKKPKLFSLEDKLVYSLGQRLKNQWGDFRQEGVGLLIFANKTVLCKISKYDGKDSKWLWGVSQADRYAWGPQNWLALIFEDENQSSYSFLLFNSQESGVLFDQCQQTTGDKYITLLVDDAYESLRIQEWRHLDLRDRKKALPLYSPENE